MMRLGLICSSGGAVFTAGIELLRGCGYRPSAVVVTDRHCGVENSVANDWALSGNELKTRRAKASALKPLLG